MPILREDLHPADYTHGCFGWHVPLGNKRRPWNKQVQEKNGRCQIIDQLEAAWSRADRPQKKMAAGHFSVDKGLRWHTL